MDRHLRTAHKPYAEKNDIPNEEAVCDKCGKYFTRKDNLTKHINKDKCKGKKVGK